MTIVCAVQCNQEIKILIVFVLFVHTLFTGSYYTTPEGGSWGYPYIKIAPYGSLTHQAQERLATATWSMSPTFFEQFLAFMFHKNHRKNNRFPFLDILGYLKNTLKNPKFGRVRQVRTKELGWKFPGWDLSHFAKFGIFVGIL